MTDKKYVNIFLLNVEQNPVYFLAISSSLHFSFLIFLSSEGYNKSSKNIGRELIFQLHGFVFEKSQDRKSVV